VEFKAILAHEFGHFSQRSLRLSGYALVIRRAIINMVYVRDRWDQWVIRGLDIPWFSAFAAPLYVLVQGMRAALKGIFYVFDVAHFSLLRQMELNADLVAVSAAGSDAPVQALARLDFAQACLQQAAQDLAVAAEQQLFTRDVFFHQQRAADFLRTVHKDPELGRPPLPPDQPSVRVQIFKAGDTGTATMWADHPSHYDREQNAKRRYWRSPRDDRPAWVVFCDRAAASEDISRRFYRLVLDLEPEVPLAEPAFVQSFIDEEHALETFDPRYQGVYDQRWLELEDLDRLLQHSSSEDTPTPEQQAASLQGLYGEQLGTWMATHRRRTEELNFLEDVCAGRANLDGDGFAWRGKRYHVSEAESLLETLQAELAEDRGYLAKFDSSVCSLHHRLAQRQGNAEEFCQRYRFHVQLETFLRALLPEQARLQSVFVFLSSQKELRWEELHQIVDIFRQAWAVLAAVLKQGAALCPPPLKHMKPGDPLSRFLPAEPSVPNLDPVQTSLNLPWADQLRRELATVTDKLSRVRLRSLHGILSLQEELVRGQGLDVSSPGVPVPAAIAQSE
jgi:hypothetical protein